MHKSPDHPEPANTARTTEGVASAREVLVARLVDARATDHDWLAVRTLAASDPTIWSEIAATQQDAAFLQAAARPAVAMANRTNVPDIDGVRALPRIDSLNGWPDRLSALRSSRLGWAVAAMVALAWTSTILTPSRPKVAGPGGNTSALFSSPDEMLTSYIEKGQQSGRVVTELPQRIVLESRPALAGKGYEVLYVRQILERAVVDDLYRFGMVEDGSQALIPARPPAVRAQSGIGL